MRARIPAVLLLALAACRHAPEPLPPPAPARIAAVVPFVPPLPLSDAEALAAASFHGDAVGFALLDAETGELVAQRNARALFVPGSVGKLPTVIAALATLSGRFETTLASTAAPRGGELDGDLYLVGGGDPQLDASALLELAQRLRAAGVRRVRGRFFADGSRFPAVARIEATQPDDAAYDPALSALALDENRLRVRWRPANHPGAVEAWAVPEGTISLGADAQPSQLQRDPAAPVEGWQISPLLASNGEERVPSSDPALLAADTFALFARGLGIALPAPAHGVVPADARTLALHEGGLPADAARVALLNSSNPMAEMLLLAFARRALDRRPDDLREAAAALEGFWRGVLPAETLAGMHLENGSGLSPATRLSPLQLVAMLREARRRDPAFSSLLPIGGWSGTLGRRFRTPDVALRVFAKTGTMAYASGLAGYLFAHSGRELIFALVIGEPQRREQTHVSPPRSPEESAARDAAENAWDARARSLEDALVTGWVARY
jgi:D-alanyl-D-alanine carboxypeptidase/D-alanyl-D-alanine-endopeptidase (penicillin-binding protein 4)